MSCEIPLISSGEEGMTRELVGLLKISQKRRRPGIPARSGSGLNQQCKVFFFIEIFKARE